MASLQYYSYEKVGTQMERDHHYSSAVRIGDRIECSGQGGWDPDTFEFSKDINEQIDQAFANVDLAIRTAGGKGWEQVYKVRSYHAPLTDEALAAMDCSMAKWMPNHRPLWTCLGVARLCDDMWVEIEVEAYDPK